ncbi:MAG: BREX system Lon protease-like protein BrxL [Phycisphaerales bacterium]
MCSYEEKLREHFSDMIVLKSPKRTEYFRNLSMPSYLRDWLIMKFADFNGDVHFGDIASYIKQYVPNKDDFESIKYRLNTGETVKFLARISLFNDIATGKTYFEMPDFGRDAYGIVDEYVVAQYKDDLLKESECWGIIEIVRDVDYSKKKPKGIMKLIGYNKFCPYTVDLDFYREARQYFTTEEWLDVLISAVDYNPSGYESSEQKLYFLRRLLTFIERKVNIIELAPKQTGKSYVYEKISKRGWLVTSGTISRASLLYDNNKKKPGLLSCFDYVGFDEIQSMKFQQPQEIQSALKHYLEFGEIKGFSGTLVADAGVVVLGNINAGKFNTEANMVEEIHPIFRESATLDRFHGFIPGWKIPGIRQDLIADGWALNTEYFAEMLHQFRDEDVSGLLDDCLDIPSKADKRDLTAIVRLCSAFVKLIFPYATKKDDIPEDEFVKYCLNPAKDMRTVIKKQLCVVDPREFNVPGKNEIPDIRYKKVQY